MKKVTIALAIAAATAASTAAQAQGFYAFGEYSGSNFDSSGAESLQDDFADMAAGEVEEGNALGGTLSGERSDSNDDSDAGFGVGIGYRYNENFATELAYKDLGEATYGTDYAITGTDPVGGNVDGTGYLSGSVESEAVILRGVGILPVTKRFSLEAMLGVAYVDTTYKAAEGLRGTIPGSGNETSGSESDSDLTAAYGLGASFQFTDTLAAYARWERIHDIDTADYLDGVEVDTYSAGLRYAF